MWDNTKSKWGCKASGGFKRKISGFKKTALVVDVSVVVAIAQANTHHPPPPKKIKNWQNCCFVSLNTFMKSVQNRSLSSEICQENFCEIGFILIIVFWGNLSQIFPQDRLLFPRICLWKSHEIWLFSVTYQRPCIMNGLHYESSWSGCLFLSPPTLFCFMNVSNVQSWPIILKKVNVRITLEA